VANALEKIHWHPGFYGAAELEFIQNRDVLEFEQEHSLGKEPLRIDLLIVKKNTDVPLENEIGRIFRRYNILEYKSPDDGLTIDDFVKTVGYACIYKSQGDTVDQIPLDELTVSVFRESYPKELMEALGRLGATVTEQFPGIYYVTGLGMFDSQIVVTGQLQPENHSCLRVLSKNATEADVRAFLGTTERLPTQGGQHSADAVLQVSISANGSLYAKLKEDMAMCEALERLMKNEIDQKVAVGRAEGKAEGKAEGAQDAMTEMIWNLMCSQKLSAEDAMAWLKIPAHQQAALARRIAQQN
jgi:hypothetical protein